MSRVTGASGLRPLHLAILLFYGAFLTWPALSTGYIPSRDVLIHLLWSMNFSNQLWAGEWYPRWLDQMNGGLGSPVFFFYAPLPYYFTALLKPLFHADPEGWHQLGVAASAAVILSGLSAYLWLRLFVGAAAALVAAIVYMSAPYHLAFDLYQRFAFAELWAFAWLPLVLWGAYATVRGSVKAPLSLGLAYAALLLTHLPTAMIFSPVVLAYAAFCAGWGARVRGAMVVAGAMALGIGLAAAYLVPALATQHNVSLSDMRVGRFSYSYHFLFYGPRFDVDIANMVTQQGWYAAVMIMACMAASFMVERALADAEIRQARFWMSVAVLVFVMMLPVARPIWNILPPLQAIQFPWRFNILLTLAMASLIALWMESKARKPRPNLISLMIVCLIVIGQSLPTLAIYLALSASPGDPGMDKMFAQFGTINVEAKEKVLAARMAIDVAEYRPRWVPRELNNTSEALRVSLTEMHAAFSDRDKGTVAILSRSPRRILLAVNMPAEGWVKVPHFYYPGWRAVTVESGARLAVRPSIPEGLLEINARAGRHEIIIELVTSMTEWAGWAISGSSIGLLGFIAYRTFRRKNDDQIS